MASLRVLILAAALVVITFLLTILSCTIVSDKSAYPLLSLFIMLLTPMPAFLCGFPSDSLSNNGLEDVMLFITGALSCSAPALSCVLYHTGVIVLEAFLLSIGSQVAFALAAFLLIFTSMPSSDESYNL
ncbi:hypothetical protein TRVL_01227 [Trypanosoma vivax]|uniref:Vacuolar protein sorting 55 n=1 Tax=Trypanosoma vivax (strain Y486) TaxID=1055687 RepID=G0TSL0_TRYVY|nr:hypothetical protein TRVL_01227 [Trypanosoma vivax]CCC46937.1 conserved hypothetical protein [Trypanosoma vivax Y486]